MDTLKNMKEQLTSCVQGQLTHIDNVDTKELGEAVDMIKDLAEAIYYCTITEAMEEKDKEKSKETYYYTERYIPTEKYMPQEYYRDMDMPYGRAYYSSGGISGQGGNGSRGYISSGLGGGNGVYHYTDMPRRDMREGRSPMVRKIYMESKEIGDKGRQIKDLENYMKELSEDVTEMIEDATQEERNILHQKLTMLASKILKNDIPNQQ